MKFRAILALLAFLMIISPILGQVPGFLKDPAISPDGNQVCFVFADDLWIVDFAGGDARRLTDTKANEWGPVWSPDGEWIAFNSNREGQTYPYLISAQGGESRVIIRETYTVADWFNDSRHLLVLRGNPEFGSSFYKLPISSDRPLLLGEIGERWASLSPDNSKIVFSRYGYAHREAYTGSMNGDLWMLDIPSGEYMRLTRTDLTERYPRYSHFSNSLFYSYSDGTRFQLTRVDDMDFESPFQVSNLTDFSARDLSIARANDRIVFEHFNDIYKYDPTKLGGPRIQKLEIRIAQDMWQNPIVEQDMKNDIVDYAVSDDELLVAFTYKYDNFIVPRKGGKPIQITHDHAGWANMVFISDRELILSKLDRGREKLFTMSVDDDLSLKPFSWFGADSLAVKEVSKDAQGRLQIKYQDSQNAGRVAIADKGSTVLRPIDAPGMVISNFAINSSGTHAVYCTWDNYYFISGLYLYDLETDTHHKMFSDDRSISNIHWMEDNRSLVFTRDRNIYRLDLVPRDEYEFDVDHWDEIFEPSSMSSDNPEQEDNQDAQEEEIDSDEESPDIRADAPVKIVWESLDKRLYQLYSGSLSSMFVVSVLSDSTFLFVDRPWYSADKAVLYKGDIYGKNKKEEASFSKETLSYKLVNKNLYYLDGYALKSYHTTSRKRSSIDISMDYQYDIRELNTRVFEQAWGIFADNFYDPNFHGQDWQALYRKYRPFVTQARDINEVGTIIDEMVGDLNASHTGFYPRQDEPSHFKQSASLGLELDYREHLSRGIRIQRVYPTTRIASVYEIRDGDILTHIDEEEILPNTAMDEILRDKVGKLIKFRIMRDDQEITGQVRGLSYRELYNLYYEYVVDRRRQAVHEATNNRVGYIHLPAMGTVDYENFYRDFFRDNHDKEALIIDFRGNRGGRVHDDVISLLTKQTYAYSYSRLHGPEMRPEPRFAITIPTVVLVDEKSFSDGEIFPVIYQELNLGKVIGYPSSGAVIGTVERTLLDGSRMRMARTGWYMLDGTNMEGTGVMPDIMVEHSLNDIVQNNDKQLLRAIEEILGEIE
jgi:C-terminal processing protease CtpA/Prc/Tol biopolymer transport system component